MAKVNIPTFKLNNGREIPAVGFGTWIGLSEKAQQNSNGEFSFELDMTDLSKLVDAMEYAIDAGYRNIDTAHVYRVEPEVGQVINKKIKEGVVKREDIFLSTKVWHHFHREADVEKSIRGSLRRLNVDYVDMALMHWPFSISQEGVDEKIDYLETWRGLEKVLEKGLTKSIGVSNFNIPQMKRLLANCKVPPTCNQIEINLNLGQDELVEYCQSNGVLVVGYSPFGTMVPSRAPPDSPEPKLNNPTLVGIAKKHGKTVSQIALRYLYERGIVSVPKTITKSRAIENASIFDFSLDKTDMATLKKFDCGYRTVRPVFYQPYENYPFEKIDQKAEIPASLMKWKNGGSQDID